MLPAKSEIWHWCDLKRFWTNNNNSTINDNINNNKNNNSNRISLGVDSIAPISFKSGMDQISYRVNWDWSGLVRIPLGVCGIVQNSLGSG